MNPLDQKRPRRGRPRKSAWTNQQKQEELWRRGILVPWKCHSIQKKMSDAIHKSKKKKFVVNCSRRLGKCLEEGTLVATPTGPVPIEKLRPGDTVFGYNKDGSVSPTTVVAVENQGVKDVVDLISKNKVVASCTKEHRWLTASYNCRGTKERTPEQFYGGVRIIRAFPHVMGGPVHEPHAYALGALLGDGNSKERGNRIHISSSTDLIPRKVQQIICPEAYLYRQHENNYSWIISTTPAGTRKGCSKHSKKLTCNHYDEWCRGRGAHEKVVDLKVVDSWDRESALQFLAGLIDTDGSVGDKYGQLNIQFCSQSKSLIDAYVFLIWKFFQVKIRVHLDKRDKYVNGPLYGAALKNNAHVSRVLETLAGRIVTPNKQFKHQYNDYPQRNEKPGAVGVKVSESTRKAVCWDIQVNNETSLYLLANGLVTHNSYLACCLALERALQFPNQQIKFAAPTQKAARKIIQPLFRQIMENCPKHLRPKFTSFDGVYEFPNGSEIHCAGSELGQIDNLRGQACDLAIIDEAGYVSDLEYVLESVLMPQTLTRKDAKIILLSTPPVSPDHPFVSKYMAQAIIDDAYAKFTIYDNPLLTPAQIEEFKEEAGGEDSTAWRREYLAEPVTDTEFALFPEATPELFQNIIADIARPSHFLPMTVIDLGYVDYTGILFGYWHFPAGKIVIEDEVLINKSTSAEIIALTLEKERELWGSQAPRVRVVDGNALAIADMNEIHGFACYAPDKSDLVANVNRVRMDLQNHTLVIRPNCKQLQIQLQMSTWDRNRTKFSRSSSGGHWDLVAALIYFCKHIDRSTNPIPAGFGWDPYTDWGYPRKHPNTLNDTLKTMFPFIRKLKTGRNS